jgi:NADPH:quinone reductase-like Zn-dependent oxidoreductase
MRAIRLEKYGSADGLRERNLTQPEPGPGEISISVRAAGINFADLLQRLRLYANAPGLPYVPGFEVSGTVSKVGDEIGNFAVGERVVALTRYGGYAEKVCVSPEQTRKISGDLSFESAAAIPVTYLTAWFCLNEMARFRSGETVLVHTGAGGVGTAAIQLAKAVGPAAIFSTTSSSTKVDFLREIGVDYPINYRQKDFTEVIRATAGERGVDVILDAVGGETLRKSYEILAPLGRLVSYGLSSAAPSQKRTPLKTFRAWWQTPSFKPLDMIGRNVGVFGFHLGYLGSKEKLVGAAFDQILRMTAENTLRPIIAESFPLTAQGAREAHRFIHQRRNLGKVVLVTD